VEDEFLSWQLADVTGRSYWEIASTRAEGWSWPTVLRDLQLEEGEMLLALHFDGADNVLARDWNDEEIAGFVAILIGSHVLPEVECEDGFWVNPLGLADHYRIDTRDRVIADRIAAQTGFSTNSLLLAHREFRHWGQVARIFSVSPYMFEVLFDIELPGVWRGELLHIDYPSDRLLRDSIGEPSHRRMSWTPEPIPNDGALKTGLKWATFLSIVGLVGGLSG
jgi:hypothetical protein